LLQPGGHYDYRFALDTAGTFWMHSHQGLQEQQLLAAPLIIRDAADRKADLQDVVVMLHDFTFSDPQEVLATLQADGSGQKGDPAPATRTMDSMGAMGTMGTMNGMDNSGSMNGTPHDMSGMMNGGQMDINDIDFDAYLANERTLDDPEIVEVERGGRVRLRLINGASATGFTIDLGDLSGTLIAVDGMMVAGLSGSRFAITMAQRLDIVMQMPTDGQARPILALREGGRERTGIILRPRGAEIAKLPTTGTQDGPVIDLVLEQKLRAASPLARRKADRTVNVDLAGTMTGYHWSMAVDGTAGAPVHVRHGERVEITLRNQSMMSHPMHLHGHHFQVVAINGTRLFGALRDTVLVPAGRNVTIAFDADNPGKWAFHCHHMYHMATGMFTTLNYGSIT
jgi:FtsP/CotA-like multicopper oxidase with cupredoxin domain